MKWLSIVTTFATALTLSASPIIAETVPTANYVEIPTANYAEITTIEAKNTVEVNPIVAESIIGTVEPVELQAESEEEVTTHTIIHTNDMSSPTFQDETYYNRTKPTLYISSSGFGCLYELTLELLNVPENITKIEIIIHYDTRGKNVVDFMEAEGSEQYMNNFDYTTNSVSISEHVGYIMDIETEESFEIGDNIRKSATANTRSKMIRLWYDVEDLTKDYTFPIGEAMNRGYGSIKIPYMLDSGEAVTFNAEVVYYDTVNPTTPRYGNSPAPVSEGNVWADYE